MRSSHSDESWWLTPDQRQLLLAIFADDAVASRARKEWLRHASIATVAAASMPLVPLLFRKSSNRAIDETVLTPFKGVYRRTWYQNHLIVRELVVALARLREAGIKTLLPADLSLLVATYQDIGARSLDNPAVVVDPDQASRAVDVLLEAGWKDAVTGGLTRPDLDATSTRLSTGTGAPVELRWDAGRGPLSRAERELIWSTAVPASVLGEHTLALSATEQLLGTPRTGCWNPVASGRWVADALMIFSRPETTVDWNRVLQFARPSRRSLWLSSRLTYLRNQWCVPIPAHVLEAVDQAPRSVIDRLEYRVRRSGISASTISAVFRASQQVKRWHGMCTPP